MRMLFLGILLIAKVVGAEPVQTQTEGLSPKDILSQIVGKALSCDNYSINFGANKPLNEVCVNRVVDITLLAIQLTGRSQELAAFETVVMSIQNCPVYSLYYGAKKPYEEVCIKNAVGLAQSLL